MNNIIAPFPKSWMDLITDTYNKKVLDVTFQLTEDCCMACTYCYQKHKTNNKMTWEIAKQTVDKLFDNNLFHKENFSKVDNDSYQTVIFNFIGGEPLMEVDLIDKILDYTLTKMIEQNHPWLTTFRASISSNGLLYFTPKVQELFQKYQRFLILSLTIDGNKELHDTCRVDLQGNGTYDRIVQIISHYRENYGLLLNTKLTVSPDNITYLYDAVINLIKLGFNEIYSNCVFEKGWTESHATILYSELKKIGDYFITNNLYNKIFFRFFSETQYTPLSIEEDDENWCGGILADSQAPSYFSIDFKGDIYVCIRYMESSLNGKQKPLIIDSVKDNNILLYKQNIKLLSNVKRSSQSTDECLNCPVAAGCSWCSAYNYEEFGTPNKRTTYICCMHKAASLANVYYLNKLYKHLNINKNFKMYLSKDEALKIIKEEEYNSLLKLSEGLYNEF